MGVGVLGVLGYFNVGGGRGTWLLTSHRDGAQSRGGATAFIAGLLEGGYICGCCSMPLPPPPVEGVWGLGFGRGVTVSFPLV
jgi:hypothetical protein